MTTRMLGVGDTPPAAEFALDDGGTLRLPNKSGRRLVLWYYPKADTPG